MRRFPARSLLAVAAVAPLLWAAPASADPGYPPTGPAGGGGTVTGGGQTGGSGTISSGGTVVPAAPSLPRTGQDLQTAGLVGGGSVLAGSIVLLSVRRSRSRRPSSPA